MGNPSSRYLDHDGRTSRLLRSYEAGVRRFSNTDFSDIYLNGESFRECSFHNCDFSGARLNRVTFDECGFSGADFTNAVFESCQLFTCYFMKAGFVGALFSQGNISGCNFSDAWLVDAVLRDADIRGCMFRASNLRYVRFDRAKVIECTFDRAVSDGATFVNTAIESFAASGIECDNGCAVDWSSICLSLRSPALSDFLLKTGMPELFVAYSVDCALAQDIRGMFKLMRSTFISYGAPDEEFAGRLRDALQRAGVRTFLFARDAKPGKKLHDVMRDGVAEHDRMVLICSEASLNRRGVLNELEQILAREAREGGESFLIPVTLDDHIFEWRPPRAGLAQEVRDRVVADFRGAASDPIKFARSLQRLLLALRD